MGPNQTTMLKAAGFNVSLLPLTKRLPLKKGAGQLYPSFIRADGVGTKAKTHEHFPQKIY
jgi:hypothetical protein